MKNITLLFVLLFSFSAAVGAEEAVSFKDPIFNLPMHSGKAAIQLFPNEIRFYSIYSPSEDKCVLLEDNITNVLYRCDVQFNPTVSWTEYHQFFSIGSKKKGKDCTILHSKAGTPQEIKKDRSTWNFVDETNCDPTETANLPKKEYIEDRFQ